MFSKLIFFIILIFFSSFCFSQKDGRLDESFGNKGISVIDLNHDNDYCKSMIVQKDGKIILAGFTDNGVNEDFALCRFMHDGGLDTLFGNKGKIITPIGTDYELAYSVKLQSSGKIIAAGFTGNESHEDFTLVRYYSNGTIDPSFGKDGIVLTSVGNFSDNLFAMEVLPDDKILAAGNTYDGKKSEFALVQYLTNGQVDTQFGNNGIVILHFDNYDANLTSMTLQKDGKIILGGIVRKGIYSDFVLVRCLPNGVPDSAFGNKGIVITSISDNNDNLTSLLIQNDGKLIASGYTFCKGKNHFTSVRYLSNGIIDITFGKKGIVISDKRKADEFANVSLLQNDGKIILIGNTTKDTLTNIKIIRFTSSGKIDKSFGKRGKVIAKIPNGYRFNYAFTGTIQADGKILVSGNSRFGTFTDLTLLRYYCKKINK